MRPFGKLSSVMFPAKLLIEMNLFTSKVPCYVISMCIKNKRSRLLIYFFLSLKKTDINIALFIINYLLSIIYFLYFSFVYVIIVIPEPH